MSWTSFLLGRPGSEYTFNVPPEAMTIEEQGVVVLQRNLAGDLKKSTLKTSAPVIKIRSSYLLLPQRNQFASLVGIDDTFLSFQCRNDWQQIDALVTVLSTTTFRIPNTSATRLSAALVTGGYSSIITINSVATFPAAGFGEGGFGFGPFDSLDFDPGTMTYDDLTRIVTMENPLPSTDVRLLATYTYTGWLVNLDTINNAWQGGWLDRSSYDFQLTGA